MLIKRFIIMWRCAFILAGHSFLVSLRAKLRKAPRSYITRSLHVGGIKLLKTVKAQCQLVIDEAYHHTDKKKPKIFMSNHLSLFDLAVITAHIPEHIRVVIKKELTKVPFVGHAALASEQIIVDRHAIENAQAFYQAAQEKLLSGISLWIFPEGTRSRSAELLPFKLGGFRLAMEIGADIIPVAISGTNEILPPGKLMPYLNKHISISIGRPIDTKEYPIDKLKLLTEKTQSAIQSMLDKSL